MAGPMEKPTSAIAGEVLAQGESVVPGTVTAGMTTKMWLLKVTTNGGPAVGAVAFGQDTVGKSCSVVTRGTAQCLSSAAIPAQSPIAATSDGRWRVAVAGDTVAGWSTTAALGAAEIFTAEIGTADAGRLMV